MEQPRFLKLNENSMVDLDQVVDTRLYSDSVGSETADIIFSVPELNEKYRRDMNKSRIQIAKAAMKRWNWLNSSEEKNNESR